MDVSKFLDTVILMKTSTHTRMHKEFTLEQLQGVNRLPAHHQQYLSKSLIVIYLELLPQRQCSDSVSTGRSTHALIYLLNELLSMVTVKS